MVSVTATPERFLNVFLFSPISFADCSTGFHEASCENLFEDRCKMSESFVSFPLEAVESIVSPPEKGTESIFGMGHKELLLLCGCQRTLISIKESL
jgi:hypothetical protein